MSGLCVAEVKESLVPEPAGVRPYAATDADLPPIFWPEDEIPNSVAIQSAAEEALRSVVVTRSAPTPVPISISGCINTANCSRSRRGGHWFRQKRFDWRDGYRILLSIEARFWDARERISEVQKILDSCRRLVLAEIGYRVE